MFDPEKFSGLKDTDKITLHLNELCRENGFKMWVPRTCKGGRGIIIKEFKCNHNRDVQSLSSNVVFNGDSLQQAGTKVQTMKKKKNRSQNNTKDSKTSKCSLTTKKKTRTYAPVCEASRCKFQLNVFCVDDCNWYLGKNLNSDNGHSHGHHVGHVKMNPELSSISHKDLTEDQLKLVANCVELGLNDAIIAKLLSREVNMQGILSREQIKYVRMKHEAEQIIADHQKDSHLSSAEKLLNKFANLASRGEEIYYCALILDRRGEYLVRMPPGRPRKICKDAGDTTNAATSTTNCEFHVLNFQFVILIKKM